MTNHEKSFETRGAACSDSDVIVVTASTRGVARVDRSIGPKRLRCVLGQAMALLPLILLATMLPSSSAIMNASGHTAANRRELRTSCTIVTHSHEAECNYAGCNGYQYWGCGGHSKCTYGYTDSACAGRANAYDCGMC